MSKQKFEAAKQLIQQGQYSKARTLLESIDHPKATEWLGKLDNLEKRQRSGGQSSSGGKSAQGSNRNRQSSPTQQQGRSRTTSSATSNKQQPQKAAKAQPQADEDSGGGNRLRVLLLGVILIVVIVGGAVVVAPMLNQEDDGGEGQPVVQQPGVQQPAEATEEATEEADSNAETTEEAAATDEVLEETEEPPTETVEVPIPGEDAPPIGPDGEGEAGPPSGGEGAPGGEAQGQLPFAPSGGEGGPQLPFTNPDNEGQGDAGGEGSGPGASGGNTPPLPGGGDTNDNPPSPLFELSRTLAATSGVQSVEGMSVQPGDINTLGFDFLVVTTLLVDEGLNAQATADQFREIVFTTLGSDEVDLTLTLDDNSSPTEYKWSNETDTWEVAPAFTTNQLRMALRALEGISNASSLTIQRGVEAENGFEVFVSGQIEVLPGFNTQEKADEILQTTRATFGVTAVELTVQLDDGSSQTRYEWSHLNQSWTVQNIQ